MDSAAAARLLPPELLGSVRLGWVPEPPRELELPEALAQLIGGGLPRGRLCEIVGRRGSGRTSLVHALLAATTAAGELTAVVDAADSFDPPSAARAAIDLGAVLWVRPPSAPDALRCAELILSAGGFGLVVLDLDGAPLHRLRLYSWPRLARAAEKAGTALVLLSPHRLAGSFAVFSVQMAGARGLWDENVLRSSCFVPRSGKTDPSDEERSTKNEARNSSSDRPPTPDPRPLLLSGLESHGILVHNKRGPLRASRRVRWLADPSA